MSEALLKNDPAALIDAVRRSAALKIQAINSDADTEIERIEAEMRDEIEKFRTLEQEKYDKMAAYEEGKASNLLSIELKKQNLDVINSFINGILSDASGYVRGDGRYAEFLRQCVISPLDEITGHRITVHISPDDAEFSEMIINETAGNGRNLKVRIVQDAVNTAGGAMIVDDEAEIVFNNTVERIIYRKIDEIKRVIVRSVNEPPGGVEST